MRSRLAIETSAFSIESMTPAWLRRVTSSLPKPTCARPIVFASWMSSVMSLSELSIESSIDSAALRLRTRCSRRPIDSLSERTAEAPTESSLGREKRSPVDSCTCTRRRSRFVPEMPPSAILDARRFETRARLAGMALMEAIRGTQRQGACPTPGRIATGRGRGRPVGVGNPLRGLRHRFREAKRARILHHAG